MKILFQSYNTCCQNTSGGVQVRIRKIRSFLLERGYQVDYFSPFETKIGDYDILHIFKLTNECLDLIKCARLSGVKVVLSSIVGLDGGYKIDIYRLLEKFPFNTFFHNMFESIRLCDHIIVETYKEKEFLFKHYGANKSKISILPNGIDSRPLATPIIYKYIGGEKKYILQVGRFDSNKNQLNVIRALKSTNIPVVFVGGAPQGSERKYYDLCVEEAKENNNFHFLGWQSADSELLNSAFHYAHALILPSYFETFGLVVLEAAEKNLFICMSNTLPILDYNVFDPELCFSPNNLNEIKSVVDRVMVREQLKDKYNDLIRNTFSWKKIIDEHIYIYKSLIDVKTND